jgi:ADP-ribose pyrophosphatase
VDASEVGGIHGLDEESEDIRVMALPFNDVAGLLAEPRMHNATLLIALQWLMLNRDDLRRKWR